MRFLSALLLAVLTTALAVAQPPLTTEERLKKLEDDAKAEKQARLDFEAAVLKKLGEITTTQNRQGEQITGLVTRMDRVETTQQTQGERLSRVEGRMDTLEKGFEKAKEQKTVITINNQPSASYQPAVVYVDRPTYYYYPATSTYYAYYYGSWYNYGYYPYAYGYRYSWRYYYW